MAPPAPPRAAALPRFGVDDVLGGDWVNPALAAVAGWVVLALLALGGAALSLDEFDTPILRIVTGALIGGAYGGDVTVISGSSRLSLGAYPLTLTLLSLGALGWVYARRVLPHTRNLSGAAVQAVRTGLVFAGLLLLSCLLLGGSAEASYWSFRASVNPAGPFVLGLLSSALACLAMLLRYPQALPAPAQLAVGWLLVPVKALGAALAGAAAVTLVVGLVLVAAEGGSDQRAAIAALVLGLPNVTLAAFYLGTGGSLSTDVGGLREWMPVTLPTYEESVSVSDLAERYSSWFWLLLPAAALVLLAATVLTVRWSGEITVARRNLLRNAGLLALSAPLLTHLASLHMAERSSSSARPVTVFIGVDWPMPLLLLLVWGAVAAVVGSSVAPTLLAAPGHVPGRMTTPGVPGSAPSPAGPVE